MVSAVVDLPINFSLSLARRLLFDSSIDFLRKFDRYFFHLSHKRILHRYDIVCLDVILYL